MAKPGQNMDAAIIGLTTRQVPGTRETFASYDLARIASRGPATATAAETILRTPSVRRRLAEAWSDQCPDLDLLARAVPPEQGPRPELVLLTRQVLSELHAVDCARCSALMDALDSNGLLVHEFRRRGVVPADPGRDWWPTVRLSADRPSSVGLDGDFEARLLTGRVVVQAQDFLVAGEVYATCEGPGPTVRRAVLRREGRQAVTSVHVPDDVAVIYVDVALDREPVLGRIAEVDFATGAAASAAAPTTSERRSFDDVRVTSADGQSAALRLTTGFDGTNVRLRIVEPEPSGGLWTRDGRRLATEKDIVVPSGSVPAEEILLGLEFR